MWETDAEVESRIANYKASRAFGAMSKAVFLDKDLTLHTKKKVYQAFILSILLYSVECWVLLRRHTNSRSSTPSITGASGLFWGSPTENSRKNTSPWLK